MQSQMIGMQASLDRILSAVQGHPGPPPGAMYPPDLHPPGSREVQGFRNFTRPGFEQKTFPPLPGFAPPVSVARYLWTLSPQGR